jgi:tetratricopeptide (TPR) repeat protein
MPNPTQGYAHLDLLQLARRLWRDRLESRTLKYVEENVLEAPRTLEEVPGYEIPYLYFEYLRTGDARPLKGVFYHNAMDVVTLAALLSHTTGMLADPFQEGIEHGLDVIAMAKLYEHLGDWDTAARLYERGLEMNLGEAPFWEAVRRLSVLQKRRGDFEQAVTLWERAASKGHVYAHVELAKYYEHKSHDVKTALEWTRRAASELKQAEMPAYVRQHWAAELRRRRDRLANKEKRARSRRLSRG